MENSIVKSTTPVYTLSTTSSLSGIPAMFCRGAWNMSGFS